MTYVCIWDFHIGAVQGDVTLPHLQAFLTSFRAFGANFIDRENAIPANYIPPLPPDVTFLTLKLDSVCLEICGSTAVCEVAIPEGIRLEFDDLAAKQILSRTCLDAPEATLRLLIPSAGRPGRWTEAAFLSADASIIMGYSSTLWRTKAEAQKSYLQSSDRQTARCRFLYQREQNGCEFA